MYGWEGTQYVKDLMSLCEWMQNRDKEMVKGQQEQ